LIWTDKGLTDSFYSDSLPSCRIKPYIPALQLPTAAPKQTSVSQNAECARNKDVCVLFLLCQMKIII